MSRARPIRILVAAAAIISVFVVPAASFSASKINVQLPTTVERGVLATATLRLPRSAAAVDGRILFPAGSAELVGVAPLGAGSVLSPVEVASGYAFGAYSMTPRNGRTVLRLAFLPKVTGTLGLRVIVDALADARGRRLGAGPRSLVSSVRVRGINRSLQAPVGSARRAPARAPGVARDLSRDGVITVDDLDLARPAWYRTRERGVSCALGAEATFDANADGCIDIADVQTLAYALRSGAGATTTAAARSASSATSAATASLRLAAGPTANTATAAPLRTYVVDSAADTADANLGDGLCRDAQARCTLRAAMAEANRQSGLTKIDFNIAAPAPVTIQLGSTALPNVGTSTSSVYIDGYSQPGSRANDAPAGSNAIPGIELRGVDNSTSRYGLYVARAGNTIRGLLINNAYRGIFLDGTGATGNTIIGNWIGFNRDNSLPPRGYAGVMLNNGAHDNVVGTPELADRNVIGNWEKAIFLHGTGTNGNLLQDNDLCIRPNGAGAICQVGVDFDFGPKNTIVGGLGDYERNVVGPNCCNAVELSHGWNPSGGSGGDPATWQISGNQVIGNWLGFRVDGSYDPAYRAAQSVPTFDNGQAVNLYDGVLNNVVEGNYVASVYDGMTIGSVESTANVLRNNVIGKSPLGEAAPMAGWGIYLRWDTDANSITGNSISNAATGGIGLIEHDVKRTTLSRNLVFDTNGPAILFASNPNNPAQGANDLLPGPTLSATTGGASGNGVPGATVELFRASRQAGEAGLPSEFLGSALVEPGGSWNLALALTEADVVTALQTRPDGTSSLLSANVAVGAPPTAPTAEFTWAQAPGTLNVDFIDTSTGSPTAWHWDFGDGATSNSQNPSHTFAGEGDFDVQLTATNGGGSTQVAHTVSVEPLPENPPIVVDSFTRTTSGSWTTADAGGPYTLLGAASNYSVSGGSGSMVVPNAGNSRTATLTGVSADDVDMLVNVRVNKAPAGGAQYIYAFGRSNAGYAYRPKLILYPAGTVAVHSGIMLNGSESSISPAVTVPGLSPGAGKVIWLRAQIIGSNPATIRVRAWADGQPEPSNWPFSATNSVSQLQGSGAVGLGAALGSGTSNTPVTFSFDDYSVVDPTPPPPPGPIADFTFTQQPDSLSVTFTDTSAQTPTAWAWDFGDGGVSTEQNPVHEFDTPGTYPVTLEVSNSIGQSSILKLVSVASIGGAGELAADAFQRSVGTGWGSADLGGAWATGSFSSAFSVSGGTGHLSLPRSATRSATLDEVVAQDVDVSFRVTVDKRPASGTLWVYAPLRRVANNEYRPKLLLNANGSVSVHASVVTNDSESAIAPSIPVTGLTYSAGQYIWLRAQVIGTNPTTIRVRAWADGQSEPDSWQFSATNAASVLQGPGSVGLRAYVGSGATNAPIALSFDDYSATEAQAPPPPPADGAVLVGAGDIALCTSTNDSATAAVISDVPGTVFTLGDNTYPTGTAQSFNDCYDPAWGGFKARTRPIPGNHEYEDNPGAAAYFAYFGEQAGPAGRGYYAYDAGSWRIYALNSECSETASCADQLAWLAADIAAEPRQCSLAMWHRPRFSSGPHGSDAGMAALFGAAYDNHIEIVLSGHDHNYQRFAPAAPNGSADAAHGVRQFVVGTGGAGLSPVGTPLATTEAQNGSNHGVLRLDLSDNGYSWQFLAAGSGGFTDSGTTACH